MYEEGYRLEPVESLNAKEIYERRWAMILLNQALTRLMEEKGCWLLVPLHHGKARR
jgi:hypothetical protein